MVNASINNLLIQHKLINQIINMDLSFLFYLSTLLFSFVALCFSCYLHNENQSQILCLDSSINIVFILIFLFSQVTMISNIIVLIKEVIKHLLL